MVKTLFAILIMATMGFFPSGNALADDIEIDDALAAALAQEAPLTQTDIDKFIKYFPELDCVTGDDIAQQNILRQAQWTETRMIYVVFKVGYTLVMLEEPDSEAFFQTFFPEFMPLESERALIQQNIEKVSALIEN